MYLTVFYLHSKILERRQINNANMGIIVCNWSYVLFLSVFLSCFAATALADDCPTEPGNGEFWTVEEFEEYGPAADPDEPGFLEVACCCINNVLGPWEDDWHTPVIDGCDCPGVPSEWSCDQIRYIRVREVTPVVDPTRWMPPAPPTPGGWSDNTAATRATWVFCTCTENGNPVQSPSCVLYRSNYVPVLYTGCGDPCP